MTKISTPWKKSRTYGDIHGGRMRRKFSDNIFKRAHSISRPDPDDVLPILMEENPSRDFFFPISGEEAIAALKALPKKDYDGITHVWLRRLKKADHIENIQPLAWFTAGSGVRMITLYPWAKDMMLSYGGKRPSNRQINEAKRYGAIIQKNGNDWVSKWTLEGLRKFYIQGILYHEVGHHIDFCYRHFSAANNKEVEEFADQYAYAKTANATHIYNKLSDS
ncbi:MAG: hypothetical protein ABJF89_00475 [Parasphingorhabdus sp.]|uniref:hypothetical protein n=2 Tax=Parasphingorhabdus sp. TaxID=2709688 RepID=UPI003267B578